MIRAIILAALALTLLGGAIATWGSLGSVALMFCLGAMGAALLYQRFLNNHDPDDYRMEE